LCPLIVRELGSRTTYIRDNDFIPDELRGGPIAFDPYRDRAVMWSEQERERLYSSVASGILDNRGLQRAEAVILELSLAQSDPLMQQITDVLDVALVIEVSVPLRVALSRNLLRAPFGAAVPQEVIYRYFAWRAGQRTSAHRTWRSVRVSNVAKDRFRRTLVDLVTLVRDNLQAG
jgi:hypothetical protein